jgi:PAS domain S-box-containing protein
MASERSFVCWGLGNSRKSTGMTPNLLPTHLRENPFKGELSDEQFQSIFAQNICYGVLDENAIIAITDTKGAIRYANQSFVNLSKYSLDEVVGSNHRILNSGFHPRSFFVDMYRDIANRKKWRGEIRNRAKDGSIYWVDTTIVPIVSDHEKLIGYAAIRIDITDRKEMESLLTQQAQSLLLSQKELEQCKILLEGVTDYAIYLLNPEGRISTWSAGAQKNKGYLAEEIIGEHFSRFYTDEDRLAGLPARALETAVRDGRYEDLGWRVRKDGSRFWANVVIDPISDDKGVVIGFAKITRNITDRKEMEALLAQQAQDLLRSNEELEQFAYVASHDLKAPLRGIENLVSWIEEDLESSLTDDTRTNMDLLKSRVRRLESLLDDLLAYSRAGRGDRASDLVDTKQLVGELALLVSPPQGFSIVGGEALPTFQADRAPLTQVLQNLISNAIKHHDHPANGHVWIEALALPHAIEFTVTDDGPGIPERFRARVFGMFQTLKPRDEVEGSGMGLAIVKKLIERQGGNIWLADGRTEQGLAVHFTWPNGERESTL